MNKEKLNEVFSDQQFVESLLQLETPEQVQQILKEKGIDLTVEEIEQTRDFLVRYANGQLSEKETATLKLLQNSNGELSEDELENVSGGVFLLCACLLGSYGVLAAICAWGGIVGGTVAAGVVGAEVGTRGRW